jgi:hypothetical protein
MTALEILKHLERYAQWAEVDLLEVQRQEWFHRPFAPEEIDAHPDGERILATAKAFAQELVKEALADARIDLGADEDDTPF